MTHRCTLPVQNPSHRSKTCAPAATLMLLAALGWAPSAFAEVNRCQRPDGSVIYTDRRCSDIGAVEQLPRKRNDQRGDGDFYPIDCPRTVADLRFRMTMAIDAQDVNQLAGLYHWVGVSGRGAVHVMNRLDAMAQRPLVDIEVLRPEAVAVAAPETAPATRYRDGTMSPASSPDVTLPPRTTPAVDQVQKPAALRVVQTLVGTSTPSDTVYRLHRYFGCIWITR